MPSLSYGVASRDIQSLAYIQPLGGVHAGNICPLCFYVRRPCFSAHRVHSSSLALLLTPLVEAEGHIRALNFYTYLHLFGQNGRHRSEDSEKEKSWVSVGLRNLNTSLITVLEFDYARLTRSEEAFYEVALYTYMLHWPNTQPILLADIRGI